MNESAVKVLLALVVYKNMVTNDILPKLNMTMLDLVISLLSICIVWIVVSRVGIGISRVGIWIVISTIEKSSICIRITSLPLRLYSRLLGRFGSNNMRISICVGIV